MNTTKNFIENVNAEYGYDRCEVIDWSYETDIKNLAEFLADGEEFSEEEKARLVKLYEDIRNTFTTDYNTITLPANGYICLESRKDAVKHLREYAKHMEWLLKSIREQGEFVMNVDYKN